MTKLLIIYHAGAMENPRAIFRALALHCSLKLTVVVPRVISVDEVYDPSRQLRTDTENSDEGYRMVPVPLRDSADYRQGFEPGPLRQLIREMQPDVIHVFDEVTSRCLREVAQMRLRAAPDSRVVFYGFNNLPISLRRRLEGRLFWHLIDGGTVASTGALDNLYRDGFPKSRPVERVFWGIATDVFRPMDRATAKRKIGLKDDLLIGFVGRLAPEKGVSVLRAAVQLLPDSLHCLIVGNGPLRDELEQWANSAEARGRVHLRNVIPSAELAEHLNCLEALVVPSLTTPVWKEQYGRVIAEAMACGVPVIGSQSGAIPEVIGSGGVAVPENDAPALAHAVRQIVFDRTGHDNFSAQALERAHQQLSATAMAQSLADYYERIQVPGGAALRHFFHPLRSAVSLVRKSRRIINRRQVRGQFKQMRRSEVNHCWCGGQLLPFHWHTSYALCNTCGSYVNKRPPLPSELQRIYSFESYWHTRTQLKGHPPIECRAANDRADGRLDYWEALIRRYGSSTGRVVEVGCAHGALLATLIARGYECIGVEPDERTAEWTRTSIGIDVRTGFFPDVELPMCNLFLAFDVLEHSPKPDAFMAQVACLLEPDGVAIIQTPIDRYSYQPPFGPQFQTTFDDVEHLYLFTDSAMEHLAHKAGLAIVTNREQLRLGHEVCVLRKP